MTLPESPLVQSLSSHQAPTQARALLFGLLWLAIAVFPLGRAAQTIPPLLAMPVLLFIYVRDWAGCTLRRFPLGWSLGLFGVALTLQLVLSHWPVLSWDTVSPNMYRGYLLFFCALEVTREEKDLRRLTWAFVLPALYMGLDGVWQLATGASFITGSPIHLANTPQARLTGSFGGTRVGDFIALFLLPSFAVWFLLPLRALWARCLLCGLLLAPPLTLWLGAQARSGYLAVLAGLYLVLGFLFNKPRWFTLLLPPLALGLLLCFGPSRVSLDTAMSDGRVPIWNAACESIKAFPWFGSGAGTYIPSINSLGIQLAEGNVQHPHNAYLQWLVDGGVVSFVLLGTLFALLTLWSWRELYRGLCLERRTGGRFWTLTAFYWAGWVGYLTINLTGHDFYRVWLVSSGMILLGITLAACTNGPKVENG